MIGSEDPGFPLDALCEQIVTRYHAALQRSLPRIRDELTQLTASTPSLRCVSLAFGELADRIEGHLAKEENLLFPALESLAVAEREGGTRPALPFATILHPIRLMETEHVGIEAALDRLCEAVSAVAEPDSLSPSWQSCATELAQLALDLREHHRVEDTLLFPRAIELDRRLL
jgi:regulator of cell morphogenesis and NO signaling